MMSKSGKLRALVKELKTKYADDDGAKKHTPQFIGDQVTVYKPYAKAVSQKTSA